MKIDSLTKEQTDLIPLYVERWTRIGLDTTSLGLDDTKRIIYPVYRELLKRQEPREIIIAESPLSAWILCCSLEASVDAADKSPSVKNVISKDKSPSVKNVISAVSNITRLKKLPGFVWPYLDGHWMAGYFAYYSYMNEVLGVEFNKNWKTYMATSALDLVYPLDCGICVVSKKPSEIHLKDNRLHNTMGPAVKYSDFEIYALNGVRVPKRLVMTPSEKLDAKMLLTEKNAEVRREFVRKIGIERVIVKLGAKSLDKSTDGVYELLDINLGDGRTRPYLKMRNPSIATWHVEGVHPDCKTVEQALNWRNQTEDKPVQLT